MATSIIVVNWNTREITAVCLERIRRYTNVPYELIVVDNGSSDGSPEFLKSVAGITKLVLLPENCGFAGGYNRGIEAADENNDVLLLNSDAFVTRGWLRRMLDCRDRNKAGMVGPCTNRSKGKQRYAPRIKGLFPPWFRKTEAVDYLSFFCVLISRPVLQAVGLLDQRFTFGMFEDDDYCRRAQRAGFKLYIDGKSWVWHEANATFSANRLDFRGIFETNRQQFDQKWSS